MGGAAADQGMAWPDAPIAGGTGMGAPSAQWGRAPTPMPQSYVAGRGPATPMGRQWGAVAEPAPPPPPPAPSWGNAPATPAAQDWGRGPAVPSSALGDAWPSVGKLPNPAPRQGGISLPFGLNIGLNFGRGKGGGARQPVFSPRIARSQQVGKGGQGWNIVMPANDPNQQVSFVAPPTNARRPNQRLAYVLGLSQLTLNLVLLAIIIAILAIPLSIAYSRLSELAHPTLVSRPTATARAIPAPPAGFKTLENSALDVAYPSAWKHASLALALNAAGNVQSDLYQQNDTVAIAFGTAAPLASSNLQAVLSSGVIAITPGPTDSFNPISPPQLGPTIDGVRWLRTEYTFNLVGSHQSTFMHAVALIANRGSYTYLIVYQAPDSQFGALAGQYFQPMLNSFRFRP